MYNPVSVFPHPVPLKFLWLAGAALSFLCSVAFKHILQLFHKIFQCVFNCTHLMPLIPVEWKWGGHLRTALVSRWPWSPPNPAADIQHSGGLSCVIVLQMCVQEQCSDHCCFEKMPLLVKGLRNGIMVVALFFNLVFFTWQIFCYTLQKCKWPAVF